MLLFGRRRKFTSLPPGARRIPVLQTPTLQSSLFPDCHSFADLRFVGQDFIQGGLVGLLLMELGVVAPGNHGRPSFSVCLAPYGATISITVTGKDRGTTPGVFPLERAVSGIGIVDPGEHCLPSVVAVWDVVAPGNLHSPYLSWLVGIVRCHHQYYCYRKWWGYNAWCFPYGAVWPFKLSVPRLVVVSVAMVGNRRWLQVRRFCNRETRTRSSLSIWVRFGWLLPP